MHFWPKNKLILGVVPTVGPCITNSMLVDWLFVHFSGQSIVLLKLTLIPILKPIIGVRRGSIVLTGIIFRKFASELLVSDFLSS